MKRLITNADDFGLDPAVNAAVIQAHTTGILTSASLLVTALAADEAVALARQHPRLGVGIHLCLTQGQSALTGSALPQRVSEISGDVTGELRAQIEKFLATGLTPTHLDSHMHAHMHPRVLPVVIRLAQEYRIRWVRAPWEEFQPVLRWPIFAVLGRRARRQLRAAGLQTPDRSVGVLRPGQLTENFLATYLPHAPAGVTEIFFHPATASTPALRACQPDYQHAGELAALCSSRCRELIQQAVVQLVNYRDLTATGVGARVGA